MKRNIAIFSLLFCIASLAFAQASKGGTMYVASKTLELKSSTDFFASTKGNLAYGDQVKVLQVNGKWAEVSLAANSSITGWTNLTNLSAKRIVAGSEASASAKEVALAGKGFNQEVENAYKAEGKLNYDDVDRTEKQFVSNDELYKFLVEGHLAMGDK
ncbi:MAG: hypothetical protein FWH38_10435 [Treponema sp.]|nr:hypothetical protein [Treponema sp.]